MSNYPTALYLNGWDDLEAMVTAYTPEGEKEYRKLGYKHLKEFSHPDNSVIIPPEETSESTEKEHTTSDLKICPVCGKEFKPKHNQKYCSKECRLKK